MSRKTRVIVIALAVFVCLFLARFAYELAKPEVDSFGGFLPAAPAMEFEAQSSSPSLARKNYASAKIVIDQVDVKQTVEQKYERVSNIESRTSAWDADTEALRKAISETEAMVQRENASGLSGERYLSLSLGVVPATFDAAVEKFKSVGKLVSINTVKTDRTADFRALEAKRLSLEKTRDGLASLRSSGAALADRISLETRILEIEGQIQELGVNLGDFSELNSFCTINITIREVPKGDLGGRLVSAFFEALAWTVPVYFGIVFALLCVLGGTFFGLKVYDKLKGKSV